MDEISFRGMWWLSGKENDAVAGIFTYSPSKGGKVEFFGSIIDKNHWKNNQYEEIETIYGETIEGKRVTLNNCQVRFAGAAIGTVTIQRQTAYVEEIFVGAHFEELGFEKVDVTFPNLTPWIVQSPINTSFEDESLSNPTTEIDPINPIGVKTDDLEIELKSNPRLKNNSTRGIEYIHKVDLTLKSDEPLLFRNYRENIDILKRYFTLATGQIVHPEEVVARTERDNEYPDHETDIYYHLPRFSETRKHDIASRLNFTLEDISFADSLKGWIQHTTAVPTFHELYFNTRYDRDMDTKFLFLALCSAIESIFEYKYPQARHMDKELYAELRENIIKNIPDDAAAKDRIKDLVGSIGNQYSIRDKLQKITSEYSDVLPEIMDVENSIKDIRDTRHDLAHGLGGSLRRSKTDPEDLRILYTKIRIITEVIMFDVAGLNSDTILGIIRDNYKIDLLC